MPDFRKLRAWQLAHELVVELTEALPERTSRGVPGLRAQLLRAAMSVSANLAEGCSRSTATDYLHFVDMSAASLAETEAELLLARDTRMIPPSRYAPLARKSRLVGKLIHGLRRHLQERVANQTDPASGGIEPSTPDR